MTSFAKISNQTKYRMTHFKKSMLTAVVTLSTASIYYAQQDSTKTAKDIEQVVITGVADIAKERKTPVAVSTIKEAQIVEKLGNQEFPEVLNTTPSVYATKSGGGFGDSKLVIRGFDQKNIAVMINGMPVNDMESGAVYWSNWAGLSDVTSAMQVQRGLGASKLAIASVGGTVNVLTRSSDKKEGGIISIGVGNDDYHKSLFAYNSGKNDKGWSTSVLFSRTAGSTYANGTNFEGYNYYWALGYQPNKKHDFQLTITGAPQWHNQRTTYSTIQNYMDMGDGVLDKKLASDPNIKFNPDSGRFRGEEYGGRVNYYHKPVMSLNWDWNMSPASKLNTIVYASFGRGGGTSLTGTSNGKALSTFVGADGTYNFDAIYASNAASTPDKGIITRNASINSHNWYGMITSFNHKINPNLNFTLGFDGRYYYGYHYQVVTDLLGGSAFKDSNNKNLGAPNAQNVYVIKPNYVSATSKALPDWNPFGGKLTPLNERVGYSNDGEVLWYGGFGQVEYSNDRISAFVQGAVSNQGFQRIDNFLVDGKTLLNGQIAGYATSATNPALIQATAKNPALHSKTGFKDILGYNVKGGINFNIDANNNVFVNAGYYSKQPFLNSVYPNNKNYLNPNLTNEKITGIEGGYGYKSSWFNANLNLYYTSWKDRFLRKADANSTVGSDGVTYLNTFANINGITEIHKGIELDASAKVAKILSLNGMLSLGDWYYKGQATGSVFDETNVAVPGQTERTLYLDKVKVGGAAQTTVGAGFTLEPVKNFKLDATYRYVDRLYANLTVSNFASTTAQDLGALRLPHFDLFDLGASFKINVNPKQYFTLRGNVYNLFDKVYIAESNTNTLTNLSKEQYAASNPTMTAAQVNTNYATYQSQGTYNGVHQGNQVFFGFGRTWAATLSFNF